MSQAHSDVCDGIPLAVGEQRALPVPVKRRILGQILQEYDRYTLRRRKIRGIGLAAAGCGLLVILLFLSIPGLAQQTMKATGLSKSEAMEVSTLAGATLDDYLSRHPLLQPTLQLLSESTPLSELTLTKGILYRDGAVKEDRLELTYETVAGSGRVKLEAGTGRLLEMVLSGFHMKAVPEQTRIPYGEKRKIADDFARKLLGGAYSGYILQDALLPGKEASEVPTFSYVQKAHGLPVLDKGLSITVDSEGEVAQFVDKSLTDAQQRLLPDIKGVLPLEAAASRYSETTLELHNTLSVYMERGMIDALSGAPLNKGPVTLHTWKVTAGDAAVLIKAQLEKYPLFLAYLWSPDSQPALVYLSSYAQNEAPTKKSLGLE